MTSAFKANATNYYSINGASPINIGVGVQAVTTVNCMYGAYGNTVANDLQQLFSAVTGGNLTNRMFLQSVSCELYLQNQSNSNIKVQIYDIIARRDQTVSSTCFDPTNAFTLGLADEGTYTPSNVGVLPFSSRIFTQYFKVCKVTHLLMSEGQTHVHRIRFSPNRILNQELETLSVGNIEGLTCY